MESYATCAHQNERNPPEENALCLNVHSPFVLIQFTFLITNHMYVCTTWFSRREVMQFTWVCILKGSSFLCAIAVFNCLWGKRNATFSWIWRAGMYGSNDSSTCRQRISSVLNLAAGAPNHFMKWDGHTMIWERRAWIYGVLQSGSTSDVCLMHFNSPLR